VRKFDTLFYVLFAYRDLFKLKLILFQNAELEPLWKIRKGNNALGLGPIFTRTQQEVVKVPNVDWYLKTNMTLRCLPQMFSGSTITMGLMTTLSDAPFCR